MAPHTPTDPPNCPAEMLCLSVQIYTTSSLQVCYAALGA